MVEAVRPMTASNLPPDPQLSHALHLSRALNPTEEIVWGTPAYQTLGCPKCRFSYNRAMGTSEKQSNDNYDAQGDGWRGRGDLLAIHMECENGHTWDICIGFHKGNSVIFVRVGEDLPPSVFQKVLDDQFARDSEDPSAS